MRVNHPAGLRVYSNAKSDNVTSYGDLYIDIYLFLFTLTSIPDEK